MRPKVPVSSIVAGIALIVMPPLALLLKFASPGWLIVILFFGAIIPLIIGWALQIVIAAQAFLGQHVALQTTSNRVRLIIAAWITSIGVIMVGIFLTDAGDSTYASTFQVMMGIEGLRGDERAAFHDKTDSITDMTAAVGAFMWLGGYAWLIIEWIVSLVERRKAREAQAARAAYEASVAQGYSRL